MDNSAGSGAVGVSARVWIAPVRRADGPALVAANLESRVHHAPWVAPFTDMAGFETWFANTLTGPNIGLVARTRALGEIVGILNLSQIVLGVFRSCYLGYYGMAAQAGKGLMTEALQLTVAHGFDEVGLNRIEANIQPGNAPSQALAARCGFRREGFSPDYLCIDGTWRDHERWAVLRPRPE